MIWGLNAIISTGHYTVQHDDSSNSPEPLIYLQADKGKTKVVCAWWRTLKSDSVELKNDINQ